MAAITYYKPTGYALILGSILLVITMGLHPTGGSFEHLLKIMTVNVVAHSLAIASIAILMYGFWGLKNRFQDLRNLSTLAFIVMTVGLAAGILAATMNGLVLPIFINQYRDASPEVIESIKPILRYNFSINHAFDYILICSVCLAIFIWSVAMVKSKVFPKWLSFYGIGLNIVVLILVIIGFELVDLHGFRLFIFGLVSWIIATGYFLAKSDA